ncbi:hypothetical protein EDC04DRAFT_2565936 [Pisolithus marmoratus]|nr:hypothetical protein EDC04DRAFT_2565936 [Pisolithus marmoratus]
MSQQKSRSGLRTVTRDFSSHPSVKDEPISWSKASGSKEQRLKDIQAGIEQRGIDDLAQSNENAPPAHIASGIKRPLQVALEEFPAPKKRQLPPSFLNDHLTKSPYFTHASLTTKPKTPSQSYTDSTASTNVASTAASSKSKITLSEEQNQILRLVEQGKSLFYTGSAGTGKSVLLREIIKSLHKRYSKAPDAVAITASTGMHVFHV